MDAAPDSLPALRKEYRRQQSGNCSKENSRLLVVVLTMAEAASSEAEVRHDPLRLKSGSARVGLDSSPRPYFLPPTGGRSSFLSYPGTMWKLEDM
jgi:hypothetical protein